MSSAREILAGLLGHPLSGEQLAAVTAPLEPALVRAGAGTGKTTVMAARVAWLLHQGLVAPDRVLGLTFTNKAAAELAERVRRLAIASDDDGEPNISTYHGFAYNLLQQHGVRLGVEPEFDVLDDGARFQLAHRVVCDYDHAELPWDSTPARVAAAVLSLDSELAEHVVSTVSVRRHSAEIDRALSELPRLTEKTKDVAAAAVAREVAVDLVERFRAAKLLHGVVDFGDYMRFATELVTLPGVVAMVREQYDVVLLDEYQDTSVAEERILQALFGNGHPVTAVGDPHQSIYGFRGASAESMSRFPKLFARVDATPVRVYHLTENRRSDARIVVAANRIVEPLRTADANDMPLVPLPDAGAGEVRVALFEHQSEEIEWLADQVADYVAQTGRPGDVAILCRVRRGFGELHSALTSRDVPVEVVGLGGLLELPDIVEICSVLRLLNDPAENPALLRLLTGPRWRIGARDLRLLARRATELAGGDVGRGPGPVAVQLERAVAQVDPADIVALLDAVENPGVAEFDPQARERFAALSAQLRQLRGHVGDPLVDLVHRVAQVMGLDVEMSVGSEVRVLERRTAFGTFLDAVADFKTLAGPPSLAALLAWLDARREQADSPDVERPTSTSAVALMTVHGAKGLEFPVVVLPFLTETVFPKKAVGSQARVWPTTPDLLPTPLRGDAASRPGLAGFANAQLDELKAATRAYEELEERRLMYVAATRAEHLLIGTGSWWGMTQKKRRGPSKFLIEISETSDVVAWAPEPAEEVNPHLGIAEDVGWQVGDGVDPERVRLAAQVRAIMAGAAFEPASPSGVEANEIADWDRRIGLLLTEARRDRDLAPVVALPALLSASQVLALDRDPERFARELYRPMPRPINQAARRGTSFHAWLESRYGVWSLLGPDDLPGAVDDEGVDLAELQAAFERLPYAALEPVAIEAAVSIRLGGRTVIGRIDAVFGIGDRWEVVDWKTGAADHVSPLQLAIYRMAWAEEQGIDPALVSGVFVYVRTGRLERFDDLPDRAALAAVLNP